MSGNRPNAEGKIRNDNNIFNVVDGKDDYRREYRRIFGERKTLKPGKYYFVDELGYSVHEDEYNAKWRKKESKRGITIRVKGQPFEIIEVLKGSKGQPNIKKTMHSGYVNI